MIRVLLSILFLSIFACKQADTKTGKNTGTTKKSAAADGWKLLEKPAYTIEYPAAWEFKDEASMNASFVYAPLEPKGDDFRENVNVLTQDLSGKEMDLKAHTELSENQIKTMLEKAKIIESTAMKNSSGDFQKLVYSGYMNSHDLQFEQYFFIRNKKAYIVTLTTEQKTFDNYKTTGEKMLASFTLKQ